MTNIDRIKQAAPWPVIMAALVIALLITLTYLTIFYSIQGG